MKVQHHQDEIGDVDDHVEEVDGEGYINEEIEKVEEEVRREGVDELPEHTGRGRETSTLPREKGRDGREHSRERSRVGCVRRVRSTPLPREVHLRGAMPPEGAALLPRAVAERAPVCCCFTGRRAPWLPYAVRMLQAQA